MLAPICLFAYNRVDEIQQTLEALKCNYLATESELYIFSDGSKNELNDHKVEIVRKYIHCVDGFKSVNIIESKENKGLANSIINGVSLILNKYEKVIVLEDDLITSANFLYFMNNALDFYLFDKNIQSISGFSLSLKDKKNKVYFQTRPGSWGWCTWKNRWDSEVFNKEKIKSVIKSNPSILKEFRHKCGADMPKMLLNSIENRNDSWYVRWAFNHFINNHYAVFPSHSFIKNIGFGNEGVHCQGINTYISEPVDEKILTYEFSEFHTPDIKIIQQFLQYFSFQHKLLFRIGLLKNRKGRAQVIEELKMRIGY